MAINKNSTGFTLTFSIIMVVVVGTALAFTSLSLKDLQKANERDKKMVDILGAIKVSAERDNAETLYGQFVKEEMVVGIDGKPKAGDVEAFDVDIKKDFRNRKLTPEMKNYPIYKAVKNDTTLYIIPMVGKGLWGPIWGFVSLEEDMNTVYGASFDHKTETPGLGAEIKEGFFEDPFTGKQIFNDSGELTSILVRKGGALPGNNHQVDAITGGTITSDGVTEMLERSFGVYQPYFESVKSGALSSTK